MRQAGDVGWPRGALIPPRRRHPRPSTKATTTPPAAQHSRLLYRARGDGGGAGRPILLHRTGWYVRDRTAFVPNGLDALFGDLSALIVSRSYEM